MRPPSRSTLFPYTTLFRSRLYETFGNGGADTVERTLSPNEYARTWYKQNPPLPKTVWSQRNNNNYEQTGLLTSLHYFADRKSTRLNSSHTVISYAVFCLKK